MSWGVGQLKTLSCAVSVTDMMRFWGDLSGPIMGRELEWAGTSLKAKQKAGQPRKGGAERVQGRGDRTCSDGTVGEVRTGRHQR